MSVDAWVANTTRLRGRPARYLPQAPSMAVTAVLCIALMAATAWAVLAGGWVNGGGGAVVVAVTAAAEAALLARAGAPRFAAILAAPFLGLAAIVPTTLAAMPIAANVTAGDTVSHYLQALATGLGSNEDWDFTVGLCAVLFICGYWLAWLALHEHRGVLAVVPVVAILATNVINAHTPDPITLPVVVAMCLALAIIAAAHLSSLGDRWQSSRVLALPGLRSGFAGSAGLVAVFITITALLLPPATTTDVSGLFFPGGANGGSTTKHGNGGSNTPGTIAFSGSTTPGGPLTSQPKLMLVYTVDTAVPVYLSVVADTQFIAGNWFPAQGDVLASPKVLWHGIAFEGGALPRDRVVADGGIGAEEHVVHAQINMQPGATGTASSQPLALFAGEPDSLSLTGVAFGASDSQSQDALLTVDSVQLGQEISPHTRIQSGALISTAGEAQLRAAGTEYPAFAAQYTQLSDDGTHGAEVISSLARQWSAGATNPYDQAVAIEKHLRDPSEYQYTLTPPFPPHDEWSIVYFLTQSHRGYCQYFASSMGAMLRSLGIPTRLINGYGPGTSQAKSGRTGARQQTVTSSDAHTWVEAYFPGYGWIPFEPTPPSAQGAYEPFARGAAAASSGPSGAGLPQATPAARPKPGVLDPTIGQQTGAGTNHSPSSFPLWVALPILGGLGVLLLAVLIWLLLPRSLAGAWRRLETIGRLSGLERRRSETHRAYAERFARARPGVAGLLAALAELAARAEFSASGAEQGEASRMLRTWRRVLFATLRPRRSPA